MLKSLIKKLFYTVTLDLFYGDKLIITYSKHGTEVYYQYTFDGNPVKTGLLMRISKRDSEQLYYLLKSKILEITAIGKVNVDHHYDEFFTFNFTFCDGQHKFQIYQGMLKDDFTIDITTPEYRHITSTMNFQKLLKFHHILKKVTRC